MITFFITLGICFTVCLCVAALIVLDKIIIRLLDKWFDVSEYDSAAWVHLAVIALGISLLISTIAVCEHNNNQPPVTIQQIVEQ